MALARSGLRAGPQGEQGPGFAELFGALPVAVLVIDPDGRIAHANPACELMLNHSESAMVGQPYDAVLLAPEDYADRRDGHGFAAFDTEIEAVRGARIRVDFLETQVPDRPGWRIVTLHHAPHARRLSQGERSAGARAAVGAAAMLAHEIKNPLSGIRGAAQLLGSGGGDASLTSLITTEVDRVAALIDRMQDFTDTRPLKLAPTNVYPLLDHARRVALARRVRLDLARRGFAVAGDGRASVTARLSLRHRRVLRRDGRIAARVRVLVRDSIGRTTRATRRLTLLAPRRR